MMNSTIFIFFLIAGLTAQLFSMEEPFNGGPDWVIRFPQIGRTGKLESLEENIPRIPPGVTRAINETRTEG
jgi:hypothetical protein